MAAFVRCCDVLKTIIQRAVAGRTNQRAPRRQREECEVRTREEWRVFLASTIPGGRFNSSKPSLHVAGNSFTKWKGFRNRPGGPKHRARTACRQKFENSEIALDPSGKSVVQGHHRKNQRRARSGSLRGGLFVCRHSRPLHSPIGRRPHVTTPHLPLSAPASEARRRPNPEHELLAGARERAGLAASPSAARGPSG